MKEYLLLFRGGDTERKQLSPEQIQEHMNRWQEWIAGLAKKEAFVSGQPLASSAKVLNGTSKRLTDGPFAEGKEIVGGYIVIKANDMDEAIRISEGCPNLEAESGTVEIREIGYLHAV